jgi:hypothetical protein
MLNGPGSIGNGCFVRQTFLHAPDPILTRKAMFIGTVAYVAVTVTARLTSLAARRIITDIGSYYAV